MQIGIIGSGLMGSALGSAWASAGHQVLFSYARDPRRLQEVARLAGFGARATTPAEAAAAEAVLLAVPWRTLDDALAQAGTLQRKVIISCMLPMDDDDEQLAVGFTTSGAERLAQRTGARVIGTFNTVWSDAIRAQLARHGPPPSMLYVGDDVEAKLAAAQLIRDAGFAPVNGGELANARLLEPFGLLMGRLGFAYDPLLAYRLVLPESRA